MSKLFKHNYLYMLICKYQKVQMFNYVKEVNVTGWKGDKNKENVTLVKPLIKT